MRTVPPHYIRENKASRVPRRLVVMAVETRATRTETAETHEWRCAAVSFVHWTNRGIMHRATMLYWDPYEMWEAVGDFCRPKGRTVLYAHNMPLAIRISKALAILPELNWTLNAIRVAQQGCWSQWSRHKATLTLCDSASLFPVTIHTLGKPRGLPRLPMPAENDATGWGIRCGRDCEIVTYTLIDYFTWLRTGVAGNWQMTGAGQSWAHWRHAHYTHPVLVHDDEEALSAERRAMWTGRAENWQWGRDFDTPVYEWDWENAYPAIVRDTIIPIRLAGHAEWLTERELERLARTHLILADVVVTAAEPVAPCRHDGRVLWPVGTYSTTLWWPEIAALLATGATVSASSVWLYQGAPALAQWGTEVLATLHGHRGGLPGWQAIALKHWSRTLIGRFATQYQQWELLGWDTDQNVRSGYWCDATTGDLSEFMQVGAEIHTLKGTTESDDSCPQITSYVMSMARANLWSAICAVGKEHVLYMDTDSLVVDIAGNATLKNLTAQGRFAGLRMKGRHRGYEIYGPRAAIIGPEIKFSGIPRNPQRTGDTEWSGEVWTTLDRAIRTGEPDRVTVTSRRFSTRWNEHRRARLADGRTTPYRLPEYEPAQPTGIRPPVTDRELEASIGRKLKAKRVRTN